MNRLKGTRGDVAVCGYRVYIMGVKRGDGGQNNHGGRLADFSSVRGGGGKSIDRRMYT
jgi:hypothetical protein